MMYKNNNLSDVKLCNEVFKGWYQYCDGIKISCKNINESLEND